MSDELKDQIASQLRYELMTVARGNGVDTFEEVFSFRYGVGCLFVAVFCMLVVATASLPGSLRAVIFVTSLLYLLIGGYHIDKSTAPSRRFREKMRRQRLPWQT
jgi:hypothetical protein